MPLVVWWLGSSSIHYDAHRELAYSAGDDVMSLPSLFVGSSSEGKDVADQLCALLEDDANVTLWHQSFELSSGNLESLTALSSSFDFAVLVLTEDDDLTSRGESFRSARDNVLFELGLFIGAIGRGRVFVVASKSKALKIPTDLAGITIGRYSSDRLDLGSALTPAAVEIRKQIRKKGHRTPTTLEARPRNALLRVRKGDLFHLASSGCSLLLPTNPYFDTTFERKIVERSSTLGRKIASLDEAGELPAFEQALDDAIASGGLKEDPGQQRLTKPGRQVAYPAGSFVSVATGDQDVMLCVLTGLTKIGAQFTSTLSEKSLRDGLDQLWHNLTSAPVNRDIYMPLVGSGFGRIGHRTALTLILQSFRGADMGSEVRICKSLNVIVYHGEGDWGDGQWVNNLFHGLMAT